MVSDAPGTVGTPRSRIVITATIDVPEVAVSTISAGPDDDPQIRERVRTIDAAAGRDRVRTVRTDGTGRSPALTRTPGPSPGRVTRRVTAASASAGRPVITVREMASAGTLDASPTRPVRRPRRRGAAVLGAVVVLVAIAAGGLAVLGGDAPPRPATVPVTRGSVVADVRAEGSVVSADSSSVSFTTDGVVAAVDARVGLVVRTGDVLAGLDDATARPRVAAATAAVTADERARDAAGRVPVPDPVAIARLDASLAASRAALAEATAALDAGVLRAPQDGTVTAVGARTGDRVGAGSPPAVELADLDALVVRCRWPPPTSRWWCPGARPR